MKNPFSKLYDNFIAVWGILSLIFISRVGSLFSGEDGIPELDITILFLFLGASFIQYTKWKSEEDLKKTSSNDVIPETKERAGVSTKFDWKIPIFIVRTQKKFDFEFPNLGHILITGITGTGKSNFFHYIATTLSNKHSSETLQMFFIDPKKVEDYNKYNQWFYKPLIHNPKKAVESLLEIENEIARRQMILYKTASSDLNAYHKLEKHQQPEVIPRIIICIDEFADLVFAGDAKRLFELIQKILKRGQEIGIHLIISTSRPQKEVYPEEFVRTFPTRICFAVANKIVLDLMMQGNDGSLREYTQGFPRERGEALFHTNYCMEFSMVKFSKANDENIS